MDTELQKKAHDDAVSAGKLLADAQITADKAEKLMREASFRLSNARKFESILKERQKKLDRAFLLLTRQRRQLESRQMKENERQLLIDENTTNF